MTLITWACLRYVQELATILVPQNRTQGSCARHQCTFAVFTAVGGHWRLVDVQILCYHHQFNYTF